MKRIRPGSILTSAAVLIVLSVALSAGRAEAAATTITVYQSQIAVNVHSAYQASDWTDTPSLSIPQAGMTFAVKQNGSGWLFLMTWQESQIYCSDEYCFGGIELGHMNNTAEMGTPLTPTIMILAGTWLKNSVDEFISEGDQTPISVESMGYSTQSVCGLSVANSQYVVQCYRPFKLTNASPYDFPSLGVGSTIEIGFAVGEFSSPGDHQASDMSSYVLTFSSQTYTAPPSSSTTSSSSSTKSTSTSTSTSTTTSSTTSSSTTTSSSSSTTSSSTSSSTTTSSSSSTTSSSTTSSSTTTSSSSSSTTTSSSTTSSSTTSSTTTPSSSSTSTTTTSPTTSSTTSTTSTVSSSTSSKSSSTSSSTTTTSSTAAKAAPSPTTYAEELAVIVIGFSALIIVVLARYRSV